MNQEEANDVMMRFVFVKEWMDFYRDFWTKWFDLHTEILHWKYRDPMMMWSNFAPMYLDIQKRWLDAILPK